MVSALILVEVQVHLTVTTMESATTLKMRITVQQTVGATIMEYANLVEEKTNIHVSMIVGVTRMRYVNRTVAKPLATAKIAPVAVVEGIQEVLIQRVAIIHALVVG